NNSGVTKSRDPLALTEPEYDELFSVNVRAAYFCAQQAVPHLERRGGSIVSVSSIHGGAGLPGHTAYAATKGALNAFTRALAIDLAPKKIRVNAVAPGLIETPRYFEMPGYSSERTARRVPWGRMGAPADVARVVAFLVSPAADYVTGQLLYVDGGINARMGLEWQDAEPRRRAAEQWDPPARHPLSLGSAAGPAGAWRLVRTGDRRRVRPICGGRRAPPRRPGARLDDAERARGCRVRRSLRRRARSGHPRLQDGGRCEPS